MHSVLRLLFLFKPLYSSTHPASLCASFRPRVNLTVLISNPLNSMGTSQPPSELEHSTVSTLSSRILTISAFSTASPSTLRVARACPPNFSYSLTIID